MKKIRMIAAIVFIAAFCAALGVASGAKWWEDNPYGDVSSGAWYYDAVRICRENGILVGTDEDTFGVGQGMTRAMAVTALASASGYDAAAYAGTVVFDDVPAGKWYSAPAAWAYEKGLSSGTGDGLFSPDSPLTREQLAVMLYRYYRMNGGEFTADISIGVFSDAADASEWARDALAWAYYSKIISGTSDGDTVLLSPGSAATREQFAQMFVKYLYLKPVYEINGIDISKYRIVYAKGAIKNIIAAADMMADSIERSLGVRLPVVTDDEEPVECEIIVGKTNREDMGLVTVDHAAIEENDSRFVWSVQGSRLVVCGFDSSSALDTGDRSAVNMNGSENAAVSFAEKVLGVDFFTGDFILCTPDPVISLPDGYTHWGDVTFKWRTLDIDGRPVDSTENYYPEWGCGMPHQLGNLITGHWKVDLADNAWDNPCYSDPDNIAMLMEHIGELLELRPDISMIGLIQNDSHIYCRCERCMEIYRAAGSRCGTVMNIVNIACETFEDNFPNLKFATWAYTWGYRPPENVILHKNSVVYFNTLVYCFSHDYRDMNCKYNRVAEDYLTKWSDIAGHVFLWDHSGSGSTQLTPCVDLDSILHNARFFAEHGLDGVFLNAANTHSKSRYFSDFNVLRGYLFGRVYRNSYMSDEEYYYHMDSFLRAFYGEGWKPLREYIDLISKLGENHCRQNNTYTSECFDYGEVAAASEKIDALWEEAKSKTADGEQIRRIEHEQVSWTYLRQCALHGPQYVNGSDADRAEYEENNRKLYDDMILHKQDYMLHGNVSFTASPETW